MTRIRDFLKRLQKGGKEHMEQVLLTFGVITVPFGLYLLAERPELAAPWWFIALGLACWIGTAWLAFKRETNTRKEARAVRELLKDIRKELQKLNEGRK
jgi:uncharacterized membrane protein YbhN (UPF0104 family)